ncbi:hypothetical protein ACHAWT_007601 [Skeletonema menzelii]
MAKSYGPQDAEIISSNNNNNNPNKNIKAEFATLLTTVVAYSSSNQPEELPSLLASNIDMILMAMNTNGLIEQVIQEDIQQQQEGTNNNNSNNNNNNGDRLEELSSAVNLILSFVETFVEEAQSMEDVYKQLMGKIFAVITPNSNQQGSSSSETSATTTTTAASTSIGEAALEELLSNESEAFTPGFLRHIEGECNRLASLPTISPQSSKLLEILRIIQTRILEELGRGSIGEGAIVIGQLLGYDDTKERLAVLDAGLAVRGVEFARELKGLTSEALGGFQNVQKKQQQGGAGGVDPGLVRSVEEIDERIQQFIDKSSSFQ